MIYVDLHFLQQLQYFLTILDIIAGVKHFLPSEIHFLVEFPVSINTQSLESLQVSID